jgi:hypothetical protein
MARGWSRPNVFDMFIPLVQWVEDDIASERVIVTHYVNNNPAQGDQFTRPLCPYPKEAEYKGGNTDDAANFVCKNRTSEIGSSPVSRKMKMELLRLKQRNLRSQLHVDQHLCSALNLFVHSRLLRR